MKKKTKVVRRTQKKQELHMPAVIILLLIGFAAYLYIGNVLVQMYESRQVLSASTSEGR